jgi:MFS family permease
VGGRRDQPVGPRYKWVTLINTTMGVLMVVINGSITLIAMPDIFRGIGLNPLQPGNSSYLLWMLMGFLLVTSVLVLTFGRIGDMFGRVRMYNLGFAIFTFFSILLSVTWMHGVAGALWLIIMRLGQGVGGALEFANSSAILTDAFPPDQRGLALGINSVAAIAGGFIGLLLGGFLAPIHWRLVFLVSVPFGLFGTIWAYTKLVDNGVRVSGRIDWLGNITFAVGLTALLTGVVYGIQPYGGHPMGWTNPFVLTALIGGLVTLVAFVKIETIVAQPMFRIPLFKIRAFTAGNLAGLLSALSRGGLQFMLIIWLQGIWLPEHGYSFEQTPLWAGIYMIPLTLGFLIAGPLSGTLSDRFGARPFATAGMIGTAAAFALLEVQPVNFDYVTFSLILLVMGLSMGMFASPNRAGIMNSLPADQRGAGAGMATTFQNSATVLSIGVFFTVLTIGLVSALPSHLYQGLTASGVPPASATQISHLPPIGVLFASFLGYNPVQQILQSSGVLHHLSQAQVAHLTGHQFFPQLISPPFAQGLHYAFDFAIFCSLVAAVASWLRGGKQAADVGFADPSLDARTVTGMVPGAVPVVVGDAGATAVPADPAADQPASTPAGTGSPARRGNDPARLAAQHRRPEPTGTEVPAAGGPAGTAGYRPRSRSSIVRSLRRR